jgi:hypothetical protein
MGAGLGAGMVTDIYIKRRLINRLMNKDLDYYGYGQRAWFRRLA